MKKSFLLFYGVFLCVCVSQAQSRVDIILEEGVKTYLHHITAGNLRTQIEDGHQYFLGSLILEKNSELYINEPSHIHAFNVEIAKKAKLQMFGGHHLKIQCEIFDASHGKYGERNLGIVSVEQHPDFFYPVQVPNLWFFPELSITKDAFYNNQRYSHARKGYNGRKGFTGSRGAEAGAITLETTEFLGGIFLARGAQGTQGERGQDGGTGGNGFHFERSFFVKNAHLRGNKSLQDLIHAGPGGSPGIGGDGGEGGRGGVVNITFTEEDVDYQENFFVYVHGGKGGLPGAPGKLGEPGSAGKMFKYIEGGSRGLVEEFTLSKKNGDRPQGDPTPVGENRIGERGPDGELEIN